MNLRIGCIFKRIITVAAGIAIMLAILPSGSMTALAADEFAGGTGVFEDPWLIESAEQLNNVRAHLDGHFRLTGNINLDVSPYNTDSGWPRIGTYDNPFTGALDGDGYTITGLYISLDDEYTGLFYSIGPTGSIIDLKLKEVEVRGNYSNTGSLAGINEGSITGCSAAGSVRGYNAVGGLVGNNTGTVADSHAEISVNAGGSNVGGLAGTNSGTITDCYATGAIEAKGSFPGTGRYVGGLAGNNNGTIDGSFAIGDVQSNEEGGGLAGLNEADGLIENCYATGNVESGGPTGGLAGGNDGEIINCFAAGSMQGNYMVGGLAGQNTGIIEYSYATGSAEGASLIGGLVGTSSGGTLNSCFAVGAVTATDESCFAGGLAGSNNEGDITGCYAASAVSGAGSSYARGLVGISWSGGVTDSYYDISACGQLDNGIGIPATSAQMVLQSTFAGWDFNGIWTISEGVSYPYFRWGTPNPLPKPRARVIIEPSSLTLYNGGDPAALTATVEFSDYPDTSFSWSAEHPDVAAVDENGIVTPVGVGQTLITAVADPGGYTGHAQVTVTDAHFITNAQELDDIRNAMDGIYVLANDIDLNAYLSPGGGGYNGGAGWEPIGTISDEFAGTFDGAGHNIMGLFIDRPDDYYIGLFGWTSADAVIKNVSLSGVDITAYGVVGSLAGWNEGEISGCAAQGGLNDSGDYMCSTFGGLAGHNEGRIIGSHAAVNVQGTHVTDYGGLAGENEEGEILNCYATGNISGGGFGGGLVGDNSGPVTNCYATGNVNAGSYTAGGLIGWNGSSVSNCYATGDVICSSYYAGGFAGWNSYSGSISDSYAVGNARGTREVGGLVGRHEGETIVTSYSAGLVTGTGQYIGGLVGRRISGALVDRSNYCETSGRTDTGKGQLKTIAEMKQQGTFTAAGSEWDFDNVWRMDAGKTYPYLQWQTCNTDFAPPLHALDPADGASGVAVIVNPSAAFDEPVYNAEGTVITDPASKITFKKGGPSGVNVYFTAVINEGEDRITVSPSEKLDGSESYYLSVSGVSDDSGNAAIAANTTFSTEADPAPPSAPILAGKTHNSVTLQADPDCEFRKNAGVWQSSNVFTGLLSSTEYTFTARIRETQTRNPSADSPGLIVMTNAAYTVTYDANGGSGTAPLETDKITGEAFAAANNTFTAPAGKLFREWNTAASGTGIGYLPGATVTMPAGNLTLYAIWKMPVAAVIITPGSLTLSKNDVDYLTATVLPEDATYPHVTWTSSNKNVATVNQSGRVTAVGAGEAVITAAADGKSDTCDITVISAGYNEDEPDGTPEPSSTPVPSAAPAQTAEGIPDTGGETELVITITPKIIEQDEEAGTITVEIKIPDLPEGTTSIEMPNGDIIHIGDGDTFRVEIPMRDIGKYGIVPTKAFNEEGVQFASIRLKIAFEAPALPIAANAQSGFWSVLLWVLIGLIGAGLVMGVVYVVHRNRNSG